MCTGSGFLWIEDLDHVGMLDDGDDDDEMAGYILRNTLRYL